MAIEVERANIAYVTRVTLSGLDNINLDPLGAKDVAELARSVESLLRVLKATYVRVDTESVSVVTDVEEVV